MKMIGIAGVSGSGKNTVAGFLASILCERGFSVGVDAFGTGIKRELTETLGWNGEKDAFWRRAMQLRGECGRKHSASYWIAELRQRWARVREQVRCMADFLIICDVRYRNEAEFCRDSSAYWVAGVNWLVTGRGGLQGAEAQHPSEAGVSAIPKTLFAAEIANTGTLGDLKAAVRRLVAEGRHLGAETPNTE